MAGRRHGSDAVPSTRILLLVLLIGGLAVSGATGALTASLRTAVPAGSPIANSEGARLGASGVASPEGTAATGAAPQVSGSAPSTWEFGTLIATVRLDTTVTSTTYDPGDGLVYAAEVAAPGSLEYEGSIHGFDPSTGAFLGSLVGPREASALAYDSDNGDLYATNSTGANVTVVEGVTVFGQPLGSVTVSVGRPQFAEAVDPENGYIYVVDELGSNVSVIDGATNTLLTTIALPNGSNPTSIAFDPVVNQVYVTDDDLGNVSIIDAVTNTLEPEGLAVGGMPYSVVYDAADGEMVVENVLPHSLNVIDAETGRLVGPPIALGTSPYESAVYDSGNGFVYLGSPASAAPVLVFDGATETVAGSIPGVTQVRGMTYDSATGDVVATGAAGLLIKGVGTGNTLYVVSTLLAAGAPTATLRGVPGPGTALGAEIPLSGNASGTAFDSRTGDLFVAYNESGQVGVINGSTGRIMGTVTVDADPTSIAYDSTNGDLYVTDQGSDNVSVINGATLDPVVTLPVGTAPTGIAYDAANGDLYVANSRSENLTVVDGASDRIVTTIATGVGPVGVAYDPVTDDVYVTNSLSNNLTVISGASNTVVAFATATVLAPRGVVCDGVDGDVYVVSYVPEGPTDLVPGVTVLSGENGSVVGTIPLGGTLWGIAYASTSGDVYVTDAQDDDVRVLSGVLEGLAVTIPVGHAPVAVSYDSANGELFVSDGGTANLTVIATLTNTSVPVGPTIDLGQSVVITAPLLGLGSGGLVERISSSSVLGRALVCSPDPVGGTSISGVCSRGVPGTYLVTLSVTDSAGASVSSWTTLTISDDPATGAPSAIPAAVDVGQSTVLNVGVTGGSGAYTFAWSGLPPGCESEDAAAIVCAPTVPGTSAINVTVSDGNDLEVVSPTIVLTVAPALGTPTVTASATSVNPGTIVTFTAAVSGGSGGDSYVWGGLPSGCASVNAASVSCTPNSTVGSPFVVTVTVIDSNGASVTGVSSAVSVTAKGAAGTDWLGLSALALGAVAVALAGASLLRSRPRGGGGRREPPPPSPGPAGAAAPGNADATGAPPESATR